MLRKLLFVHQLRHLFNKSFGIYFILLKASLSLSFSLSPSFLFLIFLSLSLSLSQPLPKLKIYLLSFYFGISTRNRRKIVSLDQSQTRDGSPTTRPLTSRHPDKRPVFEEAFPVVLPDLAKFRQFGKILQVFGQFIKAKINIRQNFTPTLVNWYAFW